MKIRLIASDIDGTLLPFGKKEFSKRTLAIAQLCRRSGIAFTVFTGRSFAGAMKAASLLGVEGPIVTANGSIVMGTDARVIKAWRFDAESAGRIAGDLAKMGLPVRCYVPEGVYRIGEAGGTSRQDTEICGKIFTDVVNDKELFFEKGIPNACKIEAYSDDTALMKSLAYRYSAMGCGASQAYPVNVEILPPGCGKGAALIYLCGRMGIRREECAAIGDNTNDIEMIRAAGLGIAMGNAVQALRDAADLVTDDAEHDGAANAVERIISEEI